MTAFLRRRLVGQGPGRAAVTGCVIAGALMLSACMGSGDRTPPPAVAAAALASDDTASTTKPKAISNSSIPVLVNDVPITAYDINQRYRLMRLGGGKGTQQSATEELIDETLEMIEAERRGVAIPDGQVDGAYAAIAQNLKMAPAQLNKALSSQGIDSSSLKKRLRAQMAWGQLVQRRTQLKATVKTEDVTAALLEKGDPEAQKLTELTLQQIVFVVPAGSSAGLYAQRRNEAAAFRQRFAGCDQSLAQAKQLRGVVVKDIGRRDSSQLTGTDGEAIVKTPAGKTAPPVQTVQGVELIAVCTSRDIQSTSVARAEVENSLFLKQAADLGKDYLKELRDRAIIEYR